MAGVTTYDLFNLRNYWSSTSGGVYGWYDLNSYIGKQYFFYDPSTGYGDLATVPGGQQSLYFHVGKSPINEWGSPPGGGGK